jgi:hypothetical protein
MNTQGEIKAKYKDQTYRLVGVKAMLRSYDSKFQKLVWAPVEEVEVLADVSNGASNGSQTDISEDDVSLLLSALDKEARVFRSVATKNGVLGMDKKLARAKLGQINVLKEKIQSLS